MDKQKKDMFARMRGFRGVYIPAHVWCHPELTWLEKLIAAEIESQDSEECGGCISTLDSLGAYFDIAGCQVARIISKLTKLNLTMKVFDDGKQVIRAGYTRTSLFRMGIENCDAEITKEQTTEIATQVVRKRASLLEKAYEDTPIQDVEELTGVKRVERTPSKFDDPSFISEESLTELMRRIGKLS